MKKNLPERLALVRHLLDVLRRQPGRQDARVLGVKIIDDESEMAVAVAQVVRLGAALVDGELHLERRSLPRM